MRTRRRQASTSDAIKVFRVSTTSNLDKEREFSSLPAARKYARHIVATARRGDSFTVWVKRTDYKTIDGQRWTFVIPGHDVFFVGQGRRPELGCRA